MRHRLSFLCAALCVLGLAGTAAAETGAEPTAEQLEFFEKSVRPLLAKRCYECHGPKADEPSGGLRLASRASVLTGGDSGAAVVPGEPQESLLIDAVNYGDLFQMPPKSKLPDEEIAILMRWVEMGAPWPGGETVETAQAAGEMDLEERRRQHWAWHGLKDHAPPAVKKEAWPRRELDRFILARLEEAGLEPAPPADKLAWLRRVYFDLIGLPPTPEQVQAFARDGSPAAYERVVDELLDSPHFGERWGRHWLDLVRYAESRGHEFDYNVPNAWQYRDYVIRALNADVPYDQFVTEHVAGDLLDEPRRHPEKDFNESVLGTGFWFLGEWVHSPVDTRKDETDRFDNMVDVASKAFLGLTVACARCHAHKFDAISQEDYYALFGYLQSSSYRQVRFDSLEHNRGIAEEIERLRYEHRFRVAEALAATVQPGLRQMDKYLLAARELVPEAKGTPAPKDAVDAGAARFGLDAGRLAAWVKELQEAAESEQHPLHGWSLLAGQDIPLDDASSAIAARLDPLLGRWQQAARRSEAALENARVIVDYADPGPGDWIQDGVTFGLGPRRNGELWLGTDEGAPLARVVPQGGAGREPAFRGLKLVAGAQNDPGKLSGWVRAGRTLRTPSFRLETGRLFYLVRGSGHVYTPVDSHRMNNGPLHGAFVHRFEAPDRAQWVEHNLSAYKGHRLHVEFTPQGEKDLEVLMVVEAPGRPGDLKGPNGLLAEMLAAPENRKSPAALAEAYRELFTATAGNLAANKIAGSGHATDGTELANWLIGERQLFSDLQGGSARLLAAAASRFREEYAKLAGQVKHESRLAPAMLDGSGVDDFLLIRGNHKNPGDVVPRRFLEALGGKEMPRPQQGSGRLELARQMTDPEINPLLPRVMVNRVWHHLMGRGIVASVDNFGVLGKAPTHPELLDHLAVEFVREGWSLKRLLRSIVLSNTYRMSSRPEVSADEADPANELWHRMPIRRLQAEAVRDAVLACSGRLDRTMYGRSVPVNLTPFMTGRGRPPGGPLDGKGRRTIYLAVRRNFLSPMLLAFDFPIPFTARGRRSVSNVPAQALILMNDPFVVEQAGVWAKKLLADPLRSAEERIEAAYLTAFARPPGEQELADALTFLDEESKALGLSPEQGRGDARVWADLCHVLMNVKEFIYLR